MALPSIVTKFDYDVINFTSLLSIWAMHPKDTITQCHKFMQIISCSRYLHSYIL